MKKPVIAGNKPAKLEMTRGEEYFICTCGRSNNQPFCDGSHAGTGFTPRALKAQEDGEAWLCVCKHSANFPYCDGTHKSFSDEQVGEEGPGTTAEAGRSPAAGWA